MVGALILADGGDRLAPHLPWASTTRIEAVRDAVAALPVDGRAVVLGPRSWEARAVLAAGGAEVLAGRPEAARWCRRWRATLVADACRPFEAALGHRLLAAASREPAPAWIGAGGAVAVCGPAAAATLILEGGLPRRGIRRLSGAGAGRAGAAAGLAAASVGPPGIGVGAGTPGGAAPGPPGAGAGAGTPGGAAAGLAAAAAGPAASPAAGWLQVRRLADGLWCLREPLGLLAPAYDTDWVNAYLVAGRERALLLDTGVGVADYATAARRLTDLPLMVINSHADWDHVGGDPAFAEVWCHPGDARALAGRHPVARLRRALSRRRLAGLLPVGFDPLRFALPPRTAEGRLEEGQLFDLGGLRLRVLHTPGHTPGSVSLWEPEQGVLLAADTAYAGPVFASDPAAFRRSAERLAALGVPALCLGGHGPVPAPPEVLPALAAGARAVLAESAAGRASPAGPAWREHDLGPCALVVRRRRS